MCSENAKPAALSRFWDTLTRCGGKRGSHPPVMFTTRRSSGVGCNGAATTGETFCQSNCDTRTTEELISARAQKATNQSLRGLYQRQHAILSRGRCSNA